MLFFSLKQPKAQTPADVLGGIDIVEADGTRFGDFPKCPHCGYPSGQREWLPPFRVEIETWGNDYGDLDRSGDHLLISERLMNLCAENSIKGLSIFEPVEVVKVLHRGPKIRTNPPNYFKASVVKSATTVDQEASGYEWGNKSERCPVCLRRGDVRRYARVVIDESTWDGSDVFWPRGGPCLIVSARFKDLCEKHEIRNVVFGSLEDESYDLSGRKTT